MTISRCSSCGAPIVWCRTVTGKAMPVDAEPSADGNVLVKGGLAMVVPKDPAPELRATPELRTSHFATCPNAAKHRRPR